MFEALLEVKELLTKFGGHPMAAGLSLKEENVEALRNALNDNARLTKEDFIPNYVSNISPPPGLPPDPSPCRSYLSSGHSAVSAPLPACPPLPGVGLRKLVEKNKLDIEHLTAFHIGFVIGPCLNAGGGFTMASASGRISFPSSLAIS